MNPVQNSGKIIPKEQQFRLTGKLLVQDARVVLR